MNTPEGDQQEGNFELRDILDRPAARNREEQVQPRLVRDMVLEVLGQQAQEELAQSVDGGLPAALERGRIVYEYDPISASFQVGFMTKPDVVDTGEEIGYRIIDKERNEELVKFLQSQYPTAYTAIVQKAKEQQLPESYSTIGENYLEPGNPLAGDVSREYAISLQEADARLRAQERFLMLMHLLDQSLSKKIRLTATEQFENNPPLVYEYDLESVPDPVNKYRTIRIEPEPQAIQVVQNFPVQIWEPFDPGVPHQFPYFQARTEPRPTRYYLHANGMLSFDPESIAAATQGLTYRYAGLGNIQPGEPKEHMKDLVTAIGTHWATRMDLVKAIPPHLSLTEPVERLISQAKKFPGDRFVFRAEQSIGAIKRNLKVTNI